MYIESIDKLVGVLSLGKTILSLMKRWKSLLERRISLEPEGGFE
jgi:hypothetical protein